MELEILNDLKSYLGMDYEDSMESTLLFCVKRAILLFKSYRNYPSFYTEQMIEKDMERCYACIWDLVLLQYVKEGVEFQNSHSESGTSRSWNSENEIFSMHRIVPIAGIC